MLTLAQKLEIIHPINQKLTHDFLNNNRIDYNVYLCCRLANDLALWDHKAYDEEFEEGQLLYRDFINSDCNDESRNLYNCLEDFINSLLEK